MSFTALLTTCLVALAGCADSGDSVVRPAGTWVSLSPTQCGGSPWEEAGQTFDEFLEGMNVEAVDISVDRFADAVCLACSCQTGERYCVRVPTREVQELQDAGFGLDERRVCGSRWP
jgi:hypothetical protein